MTYSSQPRHWPVASESGYPYTDAKTITRTGITMNQTQIGNRVVAIVGTGSASGNADYRKPTDQRHTAQRIVVIRNGELVGRRRGR
jgi:hypothetical protein